MRPRGRHEAGPAMEHRHATEVAMSHLFQSACDIASDFLAAVGTSLYLLGVFAALHAALDKLSY
jgi:hypothetical protein